MFPGRLGRDFDPALQRILFVHQTEVGFAATEQLFEGVAEVVADLDESLGKERGRRRIDFLDDLEQLLLRIGQVGELLVEEGLTVEQVVEFLDGIDIHRSHRIQFVAQFRDESLDFAPVEFGFNRLDGNFGRDFAGLGRSLQ